MVARNRTVLVLVAVAMAMLGLTTTSASADVILRVDFNSNQDSGGDSTTAGDPGLSEAAHNQEGWSSYHANHEVSDEFTTADYDGITVTPAWPNTTDNRTQQSIDRGSDNDVNWDDAAGDLNLVTDFIGIDTRTGNGGNGDWDGTSGDPTYMTLTLGGLATGTYDWTSYHHDTENVHGPFAVWVSIDGGETFTQLDDGAMTDSTEGGNPDSGALEVGPDADSLPSTYHTSFWADGLSDVVLRFAPYAAVAVHQQIWGMNGFVLSNVTTSPEAWAMAAALDAPGYSAMDVVDGVYDIGELSGDITYEFIVQSNPLEEQASMALIGRRDFGDTNVGLKYEQWNNTGTYGATVFGVADYDYGVATSPGIPTHLVFVSSEDTATTMLYVDGVMQGNIDSAITLSGPVGIGYGAQAEDGSEFFDDFVGDIFGVAIYDAALSAGQIRTHADAYLVRGAADITAAGDAVVGDPNDGDWPGGETPNLAVDDDVTTKYLHFKGATEPTGFEVAPALGATIVTGLTLTTANDAPERDPIAFELYGSNESIEGPFELIAAGDVIDFTGEEAWPRSTMNATPIEFENTVVYAYYQIMFPALRDADSANSMQIAEVELIGMPAPAVLFAEDFEGLPLGPNVDEGLAGDAVWTKTAPEGWIIDDSEMAGVGDPATDGVTEWAGWSFADKAWWIEAAEDQDRSTFTLGTGTVAIADPDEWDDADHTEGLFNSFLMTPIIDLAGVAADTVQLRFASSWRPEFDDNYHQTANIKVSFDGADPVEVLLWESDSASPNYKPYATNEAVIVEIAVPEGAQNMVLTFGCYDAGNDWWWAIDNIDIVYN